MFSSRFLTDTNTILIMMIWWDFKMVLKNFQLICKKYKLKYLKWNSQKQIKKKSLTTFFISRERSKIKRKDSYWKICFIKLLVVLSVTKLYTHNMTFSDICNFLVRGILICEMLLFVKWKTRRFVFYLSRRTITVFLKWFFCAKHLGR